MTEIKTLILNILGEEFKIKAGGGQLDPDSVGTEEIKNGSVQVEDMDPNSMVNSSDVDEIFNGGPDVGQGGGEDVDIDDEELPGGGFEEPMLEEEGD